MSSATVEGVLSSDNVLPQEPEKVADIVASAESLPADAGPLLNLREDQIQNAISFLSHPKVKGSSKDSKVSFLERKGLTTAEIDEAFRRVPDSISAQPSLPPPKPFPTPPQAGATYPASSLQQQQQPQSLRWTQVVIGVSMMTVCAYAVKQLVGPYASKIYHRLYGHADADDLAAAQAKQEDSKVAEVVASAIHSQTKELKSAVESLREMVQQMVEAKDAKTHTPEPLCIGDLRDELKCFAETLQVDSKKGRGSDAVEKELRELKALVTQQHKAEKSPRVSPISHGGNHQSYQGPNGFVSVAPPATRASHKQEGSSQEQSPSPSPSQPAPPPSYMEVLEMLEKGETPPNVRTDINDQPPNPTQPPPGTRLQPKPKPWERSRGPSVSSFPDKSTEKGRKPHTVATELDDHPSSSKPTVDAWKPPPIPQASLRKSLPASSASSNAGDEEDS